MKGTVLRNQRTALVTGASGAIGMAIAVALAEMGADLIVVGRDEDRLGVTVDAVRGYGTKVVTALTDLASDDLLDVLGEQVERAVSGVDILVHAAGIYERGILGEASVDILDDQYRSNVRAPYRLTQLLLPSIAERHGDIIFVNSTQGIAASSGVGQFAATQHAMRAIADSLRAEANPLGVRVTTLHLGRTASERQERIFAAEERSYQPECLIQPEDVAAVVIAAVQLPRRAQLVNLTIWPTTKV